MWKFMRWALFPAVAFVGLSLGETQEAQAQSFYYGFSPYGTFGSYYRYPGYPYTYSISPYAPITVYPSYYSSPYYNSYRYPTSNVYYGHRVYRGSRYCR